MFGESERPFLGLKSVMYSVHSTALSFHAVPSHKTNMKLRLPGRMCPEIQSTISCRVGRKSLLSRRHIFVAILIFKTHGLHLDVSGRNYLVIFAGGSFRQGVRVPVGALGGRGLGSCSGCGR